MGMAWDLLALGVDAAALALFYSLYRSNRKAADHVRQTPFFENAKDLMTALKGAKNQTLEHAGIQGVVHALEQPLRSNYNNTQGVIQELALMEHKSKRTQGYWSDVTKIIREQVNSILFALWLQGPDDASGVKVNIQEPLEADMLLDSMKVTYDKYEPAKSTMLEKGLDRLFGEVTKGFQEREKMLEIGAKVVGIGKLVLCGKAIELLPPTDGSGNYILAKLTKSEIIRKLESEARFWKILSVVFGLAGMGIIGYIVYRRYRGWQQAWESRVFFEQLRQDREQRAQNTDTDDSDESRNCVICLTNPREVVLLECGHICICGECVQQLPTPRRCPVCRGDVTRTVSTYNS